MMKRNIKGISKVNVRVKATMIGSLAFIYYTLLSSKSFTWIFVSGDSGDWLAASNIWMVPQPLGSPLYISLGHFLNLFPGDLVVKMTLVLSALPAAITVALIYLIVRHLTGKEWVALVSSAVLLGASIPLSQATVLEEYSLAAMFMVLGFLFYVKGRWKLTLLALGLGSAIHIMVMLITVLWLAVNFREWKVWGKALPVFIVCGVLPYGLILYLMASDAPRLLAGGLSWGAINSYLGSGQVVGTLSIVEAPERLFYVAMFIVVSLGLAVVPFGLGLKRPWDAKIKVLLAIVVFTVWYYATSRDPTTWTFLIWGIPMMVVIAGIGLARMKSARVAIVMCGALCLIVSNCFFLNADRLTQENPLAVRYYEAIQEIPDGSAVVVHRGGWEGLGFFYALSEGKQLIPVFFEYDDPEGKPDVLYENYAEWMAGEYGIEGGSTREMANDAMGKGTPVYILTPVLFGWGEIFQSEDAGIYRFERVVAIDMDVEVEITNIISVEQWSIWEWIKSRGH